METEDIQAPKKLVERSASYPGLSLQEAIEFSSSVSKNFGLTQVVNRDDIAAVLKVSSVNRQVAAAVQFGLFLKHKDGYQIADLFKSINNPLSENERQKFLLDSLNSPKLFKELIAKFDGHVVPAELKTHLIRFHEIAEKAAPAAAEIFLESARYCQVLNGNNILQFIETYKKLVNPNIQFAEVLPEDQERAEFKQEQFIPIRQEPQKLLAAKVNPAEHKELSIPLSNKRNAYLVYPNDLNEKDIQILKLQVELLELTI